MQPLRERRGSSLSVRLYCWCLLLLLLLLEGGYAAQDLDPAVETVSKVSNEIVFIICLLIHVLCKLVYILT